MDVGGHGHWSDEIEWLFLFKTIVPNVLEKIEWAAMRVSA